MKVVVLAESTPLSDDFEQLLFSEKELRRICDLIIRMRQPCPKCGGTQMPTSGYRVVLKDIQDVVSQADINERIADKSCVSDTPNE